MARGGAFMARMFTYSLPSQRILVRRVHELFVTGLAFAKIGGVDVLLSVSVDRYCVPTPVERQSGEARGGFCVYI